MAGFDPTSEGRKVAAHTPGPWRYSPEHAFISSDLPTKEQPHGQVIAKLTSGPGMRTHANGHVLAAAFETLAALRIGLRLYERELLHLLPSKDAQRFLDAARAAIAKAEGR